MTDCDSDTTASCPICETGLESWLTIPGDWRRQENRTEWDLQRCPSCDFGHLEPAPAVEMIADFYDLDEYYTRCEEDTTTRLSLADRVKNHLAWRLDDGAEPDKAWLEKFLAGKTVRRACDIGCGGGDFLTMLTEQGIEAIGVEPDGEARAFARSKGGAVFEGTAEDLPREIGGDFDAVFMSHVLEHTHDAMASLRNLHDLLRPGGFLCVEVPNHDCLGLDHAGNSWFWLDVPRHLNFFSEKNLRLAFEKSNLEIEGVEFRGYSRQFDPHWEKTERGIRDFMNERSESQATDPNFWGLLARTAFAEDAKKYDSIRVIGRRPV